MSPRNDGYMFPDHLPEEVLRLTHTADGRPVDIPENMTVLPGSRDVPPRSWIVCDNGHRICFVRDGLMVGDHMNNWSDRLSRWHQPEPQKGSHPEYACDACGAAWGPVFKYEADR